MRSLLLSGLMAVALSGFSPALAAQTIPNPAPAQPDNAAERIRIQRLETLADLWGKLYLFHPHLITHDLDWGSVLEEAIPAVESAASAEEYVEILNTRLLNPLQDPITFAFLDRAPGLPEPVQPIEVRKLAPGIGYVELQDPRTLSSPDALTHLSGAVAGLGDVERLIVDARWQETDAPEYAAEWLRLWIDDPLLMGSHVGRQHKGWTEWAPVACCENVYQESWIRATQFSLDPVREPGAVLTQVYPSTPFDSLPVVRTPTLILTNRTSHSVLERELDALQQAGKIVVVLETQGRPLGGRYILEYPEGVRVRVSAAMLLSASGALGSRADHVSAASIPLSELPALASRILATERTLAARAPFTFPPHRRGELPTGSALTREQRLHGLFKIWTVIEHLYPHKELMTGDWSRLLPELIPEVERAEDPREYHREIQRIGSRLNDSHTNVRFPEVRDDPANLWTIPARLDRVEGSFAVVQLSPVVGPESNPLRLGDEVLAIDGRTIDEIEAEWKPYISASNPSALRRVLSMQSFFGTRGPKDSPVEVQVARNGTAETLTIPRSHFGGWFAHPSQPLAMQLPGNLAYINAARVTSGEVLDSLLREFHGTDGLVLDYRPGPAGLTDYDEYIKRLGDEGLAAYWRTPTADMLGGWLNRGWTEERAPATPPYRNPGEEVYRKPLVVLTGSTQSAAEVLPKWVQVTGRGLTVGAHTTGAQGNTSAIYLPGGGRFAFSAMNFLNPDGSRYQNVGTLPDVPVEPTLQGLREGRDEVLERGIEVLRTKVVSGDPEQ
jgi:hypothetical protein